MNVAVSSMSKGKERRTFVCAGVDFDANLLSFHLCNQCRVWKFVRDVDIVINMSRRPREVDVKSTNLAGINDMADGFPFHAESSRGGERRRVMFGSSG